MVKHTHHSREDLGFLVFAALFLALHLALLSRPFVNLESWYAGTATLISRGNIPGAIRYLDTVIANPIGSALGIVPFYWLFGVSEFSARVSSLLSGLCVMVLLYWFLRSTWSAAVGLLAACIVGLSPMFWAYSGLAYSDVPFVFLMTATIIATTIASRAGSMPLHVASSLLLAASALVKYNAVLFTPVIAGIALYAAKDRHADWRGAVLEWMQVLAIYTAGCLLFLVPYLALVHRTLGYFVAQRYASSVGLSASSARLGLTGLRLASMLMWVGIFCGPLALFPVIHLAKKFGWFRFIILTVIASPAVAFLAQTSLSAQKALGGDFGEMELGWITRFLEHPAEQIALASLLLIAGILLTAGLLVWSLEDLRRRGYFVVWLIAGLALHSLARPTNRYVLFVLPPLAIYLASLFEPARGIASPLMRFYLMLSLVALGSVGFFNSVYFAKEGRAAAQVAAFINRNSLAAIEFQPGNAVQTHCGYLIRPELFIPEGSARPQFVLITLGPHEAGKNLVYESPVRLLGVVFKRYAIMRNG